MATTITFGGSGSRTFLLRSICRFVAPTTTNATNTTTTRAIAAATARRGILSNLPSSSSIVFAPAASVTTTTTTTTATTTTTSPVFRRWFQSSGKIPSSSDATNNIPAHAMLTTETKVKSPPLVYIAGEEMTHYACQLMLEEWFEPYFDTSSWERFDLSCKARDETDDQVLRDAVNAGKRIGAIFKEPTITPTAEQREEMNLSRPLSSPNGAMRSGWNGITISRDTIHMEGLELGYKNPVFFERHAVGGEYGAGWSEVGRGTLLTTYLPADGADPFVVDKRDLNNDHNVVVVYHNPYDNVESLARIFFQRCLDASVTPYIVTKKTVFKWQEGFWSTMKRVFDEEFKARFENAGLLERSGGDLQHLISDAATMQLIRWTDGGFGMAAHNYDGDMLTDQIAQVHRSPGFITSNLVGKNDDGTLIKEFEASHGTVSDLWHDHLAGKETSLNPLGLVEAMIGALEHAAQLDAERDPNDQDKARVRDQVANFTSTLRTAIHNTFRYGQGTRDLSGPSGFTTEDFIKKVAWRFHRYLARQYEDEAPPTLSEPDRRYRRNYNVNEAAVRAMFEKYDYNNDGQIDLQEFTNMLVHMNLAPLEEAQAKDTKDV